MTVPASLLGLLPATSSVVPWVIEQAMPVINELKTTYGGDAMAMASDKLVRIGDLIVWEGETGRHVVAGLANLGESQQRIESAVGAIEATQLSMAGTLGVVQSVSMATLGLTSITAGFMAWRLSALDQRLKSLSTKIADIEAILKAEAQGLLSSSLTFLDKFEQKQKNDHLEVALLRANLSAHTFGHLVDDECDGKKRLPDLNYRGRRYLLSLLAELQCCILQDDSDQVIGRVKAEQPRLQQLVEANFRQTLAIDPEQYLHPALSDAGVTLDLLTDLYQQLQNAKAVQDVDIRDASDLFEHLRQRIYRKSWLKMPQVRDWRKPLLERIRYLIAAVEDVNRIESLRLLVEHANNHKTDVTSIRSQIQEWIKEIGSRAGHRESDTIVFRFA